MHIAYPSTPSLTGHPDGINLRDTVVIRAGKNGPERFYRTIGDAPTGVGPVERDRDYNTTGALTMDEHGRPKQFPWSQLYINDSGYRGLAVLPAAYAHPDATVYSSASFLKTDGSTLHTERMIRVNRFGTVALRNTSSKAGQAKGGAGAGAGPPGKGNTRAGAGRKRG